MSQNVEFDKSLARLHRLLAGVEPPAIRGGYLVQIREGQRLTAGSGVRLLGEMVQLPSGLVVPASAKLRASPLDLMSTYLVASEVFDFSPDLPWVVKQLQTLPLPLIMGFLADVMVRLQKPGISDDEVDRELLEEWFSPEGQAKVANLLSHGSRRLFFPQSGILLAKLALGISPDDGPVGEQANLLPVMLLTLAEHLASPAEDEEEHRVRLELGLVANQHFNAPKDPAHTFAFYQRRWVEIPQEMDPGKAQPDLVSLYESNTGTAAADVASVAVALWAGAKRGQTRFAPSYFSTWPLTRVEAVLNLLSADREQLSELFIEETQHLGDHGHEWAFGPFERFPLLRYPDGSVEVLSPHFLLRRVFGWLPFWDLAAPLRARADKGDRAAKKQLGDVRSWVGKLTEHYAIEVLASLAAGGGQRLFDETELMRAFGGRRNVKVADAVLDFENAFIVFEISTRQLQRLSATGSSLEALDADLSALAEEAEQVHSTIECLRASEEILTGQPAVVRRRFFPVVVTTEGFPVNPFTLGRLRERLEEGGLLQGADTAPVEVMDLVDLEMAEGWQAEGGPSLRALLQQKADAGLALMALRDFILVELGQHPRRPSRLEDVWVKPFDEAVTRLGLVAEP